MQGVKHVPVEDVCGEGALGGEGKKEIDRSPSEHSPCQKEALPKDEALQRYVNKLKLTAQELSLYQKKYEEEQKRGDEMREEFRQRISWVPEFWRDKVYKEHSWGGKQLKNSMQRNTRK
jgi:hypothetical protein